MSTQAAASRTKKIIGVGLLLFVVLGCLTFLLCRFRIQINTQNILNQQRDIEQAWVSKALDAIAVWRNEIVEQARFISTSEMFRLFITDVANMEDEHRQALHAPESMHSSDESLRSMAEQLTYLQDLLKDFTSRRAWNEARVLLPDATTLVGPEYPLPLLDAQRDLALAAAETAKPAFGPIRMQDGLLAMDMAEPLFEVLGAGEPKVIGILLLSLPMERPLTTFLSSQLDQRDALAARIIEKTGDGSAIAMMESGIVVLETSHNPPADDYPFQLRKSVYGKNEVYSLGARPTGLNWTYVLETPAAHVMEYIREQETQIYGLGALASLGMALLGAFLWASATSRQHKARVKELTDLNNTISEQKTMLESINSSLDAGLLLVDDHDNVLVANPNFLQIINHQEPLPPHTPLAEVLPANILVTVQQEMRLVEESSQPASNNSLMLPDAEGQEHIYRVDYFPYMRSLDGIKKSCAGCVAVLKDVTRYRMQQKIDAERQEAMLSALGRAVESVDPNLVGQSDKMAAIAALVADEMGMGKPEKDTLRIASHLSQIGKIFVNPELLKRDGPLTPEEKAEVNRAYERADEILRDLHFKLPIQETVRQIGKKLDADGNIEGTGEKMTPCGRALAVINAFIALTSQRGYRPARSPEQALEILASDDKFCQTTVEALKEIGPARLAQALLKK